MILWDFDFSLWMEDNTDTIVLKSLAPDVYASLKEKRTQPWTELMDECLGKLQEKGIDELQIRKYFASMPFQNAAIVRRFCNVKHVIVSDANTMYIDALVEAHLGSNSFDAIFSNETYRKDHSGLLGIRAHHEHHCPTCPKNLCKSKVVAEYLKSSSRSFDRIIYVGDGGNDFCPIQNNASIIAFARQDFKLSRLLAEAKRENVFTWATHQELMDLFEQVLK